MQNEYYVAKNNLVTMTSSNVSVRGAETEYVIIKPKGIHYEKM